MDVKALRRFAPLALVGLALLAASCSSSNTATSPMTTSTALPLEPDMSP